MTTIKRDNRSYRGMLQSDDGVIHKIIARNASGITFQTIFGLSQHMIERLRSNPEHIVFSERSRIARLGIQIISDPLEPGNLNGDLLTVTQTASAVIPGYPGLDRYSSFFGPGLPVGRWFLRPARAALLRRGIGRHRTF
jgi:hypothetical protein